MGDGAQQAQVVSAARFVIDFPGTPLGRIAFSELGGISSKVASQEYIYNDDQGNTVHTKQYGKTDPPTVTVKRGLDADGNGRLLAWHLLARQGLPAARGDGTLTIKDASGNIEISYALEGAWCSELTISGVKAGASDVATIECKITCERIAAGKPNAAAAAA
jgi:phage tail-like protein